ncbi:MULTISPECIES: ArsR/SmtB family transcription factor [Acidiphilium]|jgi:ArsR family transcriptional regulator|uniref:Transcriptional regulator, ArsR family n=2 Tax=Acidiphilium TaxID=522 RepID=A5FZA4_ACICJ|nr:MULTISPECIES: helix-turn-helix transcriptional regulator [Acidiphilium]MDE2326282.1 helix-turn-helix transcriptional regulator [Rhodospirillales bacterium]ABQ30936.1 transcriptional regulator, ArsR family [Acidiphilium cryptum JF-5]EGO95399.1 Regulatory protein, ArsR [Acidiphilium sp. PM]KDM66530.1 regulatory protein, ArsR [Acidiphilium sp. JA12-A1]MBS3024702.1 helix-turn-helix transcriptional regulator [Acidiphilium multivorum]
MTIDADHDHAPDLDEGLKALVHPVRRAILAKLAEPERHFAGQEHPLSFGVCAGAIERSCPLSQSSISAHLAALHAAGLVETRRVGTFVFYRRNDGAIDALIRGLAKSLDRPEPTP